MTVTIVSVSATAPLTAYASASPLAMAFWRNCLGFAVLGPFLLLLRRREVVKVARGERGILRREQWRPLVFGFLAATSLALHFASFMTSTRLTSVAMSTALVATQPVWQALIAAGQGVRTSRRTWAGLGLSVVGAATAAGLDIQAGGTALMGDLLALLGAIAQAGYTALSEKSRADVSTPLYSTFTSLVCGLQLLAVCWLAGISLTGFDRSTQLSLLGLLILPQILGLGSLNFVLGRTSATTASVLLLLETPVAALAAWWLMDQNIKPATVPGLVLIIVGVTVVVTSGGGEQRDTAGVAVPPYPAYAPHTPRQPLAPSSPSSPSSTSSPFSSQTLTLRRITGGDPRDSRDAHDSRDPQDSRTPRDPRLEWAGHARGETPTITLAYHGGGAFNTLTLRRPRAPREEEETWGS
ncbi:DMT family transporter [Streptomyces aurantiacus]|uniref:DMT family transporter n=1 Tax=Streptomyces aurantiacus TaxID=47760 RepID=UPI0027D8DEFF|nr:DMT family transporter [Streptomyces aurantiacus]